MRQLDACARILMLVASLALTDTRTVFANEELPEAEEAPLDAASKTGPESGASGGSEETVSAPQELTTEAADNVLRKAGTQFVGGALASDARPRNGGGWINGRWAGAGPEPRNDPPPPRGFGPGFDSRGRDNTLTGPLPVPSIVPPREYPRIHAPLPPPARRGFFERIWPF